MKNFGDQGGCYPQRPKAEVNNRILYILRKPNSITALLFIQNISPFLKEFRHFALIFLSPKITQSRLQVFSVNGSNLVINSSWLW